MSVRIQQSANSTHECLPAQTWPPLVRNPYEEVFYSELNTFKGLKILANSTHQVNAVGICASLATIAGDLPPNSKMQSLRLLLPAGSWTLRPAATEPVKLIWAMSMWEAGSAPVSTPPETKLMTPGGNQPRRLVDRVQVRPKGIFRRPRRDTLFILLGLELGMSLKVVYCVSSSKRGSQLQTHVPKVLLVAGTWMACTLTERWP